MSFPTPSAPASPFLQGPKHLRVWPLEFAQGGDHELGCFPWGSLPVCLLTECSQGRVRDAQPRFGAGGGPGRPRGYGPWIHPPRARGWSSQSGRRAGGETDPDTGCLSGPWLQAQGVTLGRGTKRPLSVHAGHRAHLGQARRLRSEGAGPGAT